MIIPSSFYKSKDVVDISKQLLGKFLFTNIEGKLCAGKIVETEAYRAPDDKACHAYNNKRTPRTETMFASGGVAYVYICYGIHNLFNIVTAPEGDAHAVLIRGIEPVDGIKTMLERRKFKVLKPELTNGPGKLAAAMGIEKYHDGIDLDSKKSGVWIEDLGDQILPDQILAGPRVGMSTAQECSNWPWRFRIKDNKWASKPDTVWYEGW